MRTIVLSTRDRHTTIRRFMSGAMCFATAFSIRSVGAQASGGASSTARTAFVRDSVAGLSWTVSWRHDWSRYKHPGECDAAIDIIQMTALPRTGWYHTPEQHDTLATDARTAGQACAAIFSLKTVAPGDLPAYLRLALRLNDLPLARRILDRQLAAASTADQKGSVILDALESFHGREPDQVRMADSLVQWLATLGPRARWARVIALQVMPATPAFDTLRWMHNQNQAVAEYARLSSEDRVLSGMPVPYVANRWTEVNELSRNTSSAICQRYQNGFDRLGTDTVHGASAPMWFTGTGGQDGCKSEVDVMGKPVSVLSGGEWFVPGDTIAKSTLAMPRSGHVTLVVLDSLGGGRPTPSIAMYRRLYEKYAKEGLDLVLVHRRKGYVWSSGLLAPAIETQIIRWYDHDYLELPFPIAVYDSAATNVPGPMLIGRDGNAYTGPLVAAETDEGVLDAFIRQALATPAVSRPTAEATK